MKFILTNIDDQRDRTQSLPVTNAVAAIEYSAYEVDSRAFARLAERSFDSFRR